MDTKELAYLILQGEYVKMILGKDDYTEAEVMAQTNYLFPDGWTLLDSERRLELVGKAIEEKKNLREIFDREIDGIFVSVNSDTK